MASMYNKLFTKILDSSIWLAPDPTRLVWITLLAAMDEDSNAMFACVENLAARARVTVEQVEQAIKTFESPDPRSGDPEFDGRRIERFPGGWHILNGPKYRALVTRAVARERTRERVARHRAKLSGNAGVTLSNVHVTPSEADTDTEADTNKKPTARKAGPTACEDFELLYSLFPKRAGANPRGRAISACNARLAEGHTWAEMQDGARRYAEFIRATGKERSEFVRQLATFVGPDKSFLEPWTAPASRAEVQQDANISAGQEWLRRTA